MARTRIRSDQGEDIGFVSERELNDFFADVVITGTNEDTDIITTFDNYLPNRGIFVGADGNVVTTGTNTINITGFYNEFVLSSGTLQTEIDAIVIDQAGIGSITASGVTVTGTVVFESLDGITLIPNDITNTITFSGTSPGSSAGLTDINSETGPSITLVGAGQVNVSTTASNVITISGAEQEFNQVPENAIVGAGEVVVISGSNETIVSGTPHTINTDTISDAIIGGVGVVVTSGSNETTIDGHLRYTKDENDAIIGGENVTVVSGVDTITISSIDTDTVSDAIIGGENVTVVSGANTTTISAVDTISDAIIGGQGITVTSGSNEITIDGHLRYQKNENDAILGTDGNTVISGANTITIEGFRPEFVAASGSLQDQIDAVEGSDVDSVNTLIGDITIVDGYGSSIVTDGGSNSIIVNTFDDDDVDSLTASGVTVTGSVQLATLGGTSLSTDISDPNNPIITISGGSEVGALTGSLFQIDFTNGGNTSNTWLAVSDSNLTGNTTPWTSAFPARLAGLSFSNRNDGTDLDLEFHVSRVGDGNTSTTEFIWEIRNCRTAYKTDIPLTALLLNPGDKVSIFAQNAGNQGRDVWFGVFWEITSRPSAENCEDWSGNIS